MKPSYSYDEVIYLIACADSYEELRLIWDVVEPEKKRYPLVQLREFVDFINAKAWWAKQ